MVKLISLNVEQDKHHGTAIPFLVRESPDVVCLQEVFQDDLPKFEKALGMKSFWKPTCYFPTSASGGAESKLLGAAILSKHQFTPHYKYIYLAGEESVVPHFSKAKDQEAERNNMHIVLLWADIKDPAAEYRIGNTHFTWTPNGMTTQYQKEDMANLISALDRDLKEFVLVGDMNAPRGREAFSMLAAKYQDNIPLEYDSSLDPDLHRVPSLRYVVDGFFSTPAYKVMDVRLEKGLSDHKAVVGCVQKI